MPAKSNFFVVRAPGDGLGELGMTFEDYLDSIDSSANPPDGLSDPLRALWLAKVDRWDAAHDLVGDLETPMASWIHAYLHRVEGDLGNAAYWYARAGQPAIRNGDDLQGEWERLVRKNLN